MSGLTTERGDSVRGCVWGALRLLARRDLPDLERQRMLAGLEECYQRHPVLHRAKTPERRDVMLAQIYRREMGL